VTAMRVLVQMLMRRDANTVAVASNPPSA
jgi:hypothetical protein